MAAARSTTLRVSDTQSRHRLTRSRTAVRLPQNRASRRPPERFCVQTTPFGIERAALGFETSATMRHRIKVCGWPDNSGMSGRKPRNRWPNRPEYATTSTPVNPNEVRNVGLGLLVRKLLGRVTPRG